MSIFAGCIKKRLNNEHLIRLFHVNIGKKYIKTSKFFFLDCAELSTFYIIKNSFNTFSNNSVTIVEKDRKTYLKMMKNFDDSEDRPSINYCEIDIMIKNCKYKIDYPYVYLDFCCQLHNAAASIKYFMKYNRPKAGRFIFGLTICLEQVKKIAYLKLKKYLSDDYYFGEETGKYSQGKYATDIIKYQCEINNLKCEIINNFQYHRERTTRKTSDMHFISCVITIEK